MGLLDMFGTSWDDPRTMAMLGAAQAASQRRGLMPGLLDAASAYSGGLLADRQRKLGEQELLAKIAVQNAQLDDIKAQALLRTQQAGKMDRLMGMIDGADSPRQLAPNQYGIEGGGISLSGQREQMRPVTTATDNVFANLPPAIRTAARWDIASNDGKGVAEMIAKYGGPNMQVHNGVAMDMNRVQPGFLPGLSVSQNGQATMTVTGPDGLPRVMMPQGALEAYKQYRNADEAAKAGYEVMPALNPDGSPGYGPTRREYVENRSASVQPGARSRFDPLAMAQAEAVSSGQPVNFNIGGRQGSFGPSGNEGGPLRTGLSPAEQAQAAGLKVYTEGAQKDFVDRRKSIYDAGDSAVGNINNYTRMSSLLDGFEGGKFSATGLDIAKAANSLGLKIDPMLPNKEAATALSNEMALRLRNPAGGAGMPGAMSDQDREFLRSMTPGMSNSAQGRSMMLDAMTKMARRDQDVATFARRYEAKYGRLDNGFFGQLQEWANANPLFGQYRGQ